MMTSPIKIRLTDDSILFACLIGCQRRLRKLRRGREGWGADKSTGWQRDCDGAIGELVVAKWQGVYWDGGGPLEFDIKDAGRLQVRSTPWEKGRLTTHPEDKDEDIFVLVLTHAAPDYVLAGWMWGYETKAMQGGRHKYWSCLQKNRPAFNVPQSDLRPMDSLQAMITGNPERLYAHRCMTSGSAWGITLPG
jgi:hypothetical protein